MAVVQIPSLLRDLTAGQARVTVPGRTVGEAVAALEGLYPGIKERLCEPGVLGQGERLRAELSVTVDGRMARLGLAQPVRPESEILFLPLVGGG